MLSEASADEGISFNHFNLLEKNMIGIYIKRDRFGTVATDSDKVSLWEDLLQKG